jgi:hypothetical protein
MTDGVEGRATDSIWTKQSNLFVSNDRLKNNKLLFCNPDLIIITINEQQKSNL